MPRPTRIRQVSAMPGVIYFKPAGIPARCLEEVRLSLEEFEAMHLNYMEKLKQERCAEAMKVSRPTFQRILASARMKLTDALFNGKAIRIEGGHFNILPARFSCENGHEWEIPAELLVKSVPASCPVCSSPVIRQLSPAGSTCPCQKQTACCRRCSRAESYHIKP